MIGDDYLDLAFRFARAADPTARPVLNDAGVERLGPHQSGLVKLVRDLRGRGVPVDGVGLQGHIDQTSVPTAPELDATFSRFADLGVAVEVSEADVPLAPPIDQPAIDRQQRIFSDLATACWEHAASDRFTVWGADDRHSWRGLASQATLQTEGYGRKTSWGSVSNRLAGTF